MSYIRIVAKPRTRSKTARIVSSPPLARFVGSQRKPEHGSDPSGCRVGGEETGVASGDAGMRRKCCACSSRYNLHSSYFVAHLQQYCGTAPMVLAEINCAAEW